VLSSQALCVVVLQERLERDVKTAMQLLGCSKYDVSIWVTTDKTVRRLNAQYRGVDRSTDILSFGMCEVRGYKVLLLFGKACVFSCIVFILNAAAIAS
jgi:ssRNA-specific RNase YbeY (16S rRNA maturation enzyme)